MYLMKKLTTSTCADIGVFWCRKDHSTVVHALEKIEKSRELDPDFVHELTRLEHSIKIKQG
jgi:chromosomal replication initiator protein